MNYRGGPGTVIHALMSLDLVIWLLNFFKDGLHGGQLGLFLPSLETSRWDLIFIHPIGFSDAQSASLRDYEQRAHKITVERPPYTKPVRAPRFPESRLYM